MAELLPEDSDSESGDKGSVVEMEDFKESTDIDIELEEEDADNDDDNLEEWLSDHSEDDNESRDSDSLDERNNDALNAIQTMEDLGKLIPRLINPYRHPRQLIIIGSDLARA
ncbi:hypothetical protein EYR40_010591 [Pleurotus pulmonarius]|nr:hypothetical protein EYR40_010591 [Pleurotus pulmonarius]